MAKICLREVTTENFRECVGLSVAEGQDRWVAPNVYSLAQAKVNPRLRPFAIYDGAVRGRDTVPDDEMVGFTMFEVTEGVGFIVRLLIDQRFQRRGYGRAAMGEVIRRLKKRPDVEMIATSFRTENAGAEALYRGLGFIDLEERDGETYVQLDWSPEPYA